ncbi:MAG: substrate-binding domain-containing protein [Spirochaetales bacterium]|uniref:Substrate-binding domain-containing protein n=1 Tax=Candidatus Thalassospirochaeta sargassi TaxID=3119039 RepID=A0AAJ1ML99_9SPIO|nr:substrate-binding domain-containing protein [Spirochaetales bacterium]
MDRKNTVFLIIPAVSLLLIAVLWLSLGGVFRAGAAEKPRVTVILKTTERVVDFWKRLEEGVLQAAEDFNVEVDITGPPTERHIDDQVNIFNNAIKDKPDVVILAAADYEKLVDPVEKSVSMDIPVLTVDSFVNSDAPLSQIGTANFDAGGKLAGYLKEKLPEGAVIAILSYVRESSTAIEREQGLRAGVAGYFTVLPTLYNNGKIETAAVQSVSLLNRVPAPSALVALNENSALGLLQGIAETGGRTSTIFLTFDSNLEIIEGIKNGLIDGTVVQKPYNMGYQAVKAAAGLLDGQVPPKKIDTGSELVTAENLFSPIIQKLIFPTEFSGE